MPVAEPKSYPVTYEHINGVDSIPDVIRFCLENGYNITSNAYMEGEEVKLRFSVTKDGLNTVCPRDGDHLVHDNGVMIPVSEEDFAERYTT
jgi:hypothetical protein